MTDSASNSGHSAAQEKSDGGPAFPHAVHHPAIINGEPGTLTSSFGGMSLRDWFAGQAMKGMIDRVLFDQSFEDRFVSECSTLKERQAKAGKLDEFCAFLAYDMADAMIAEREKRVEDERRAN